MGSAQVEGPYFPSLEIGNSTPPWSALVSAEHARKGGEKGRQRKYRTLEKVERGGSSTSHSSKAKEHCHCWIYSENRRKVFNWPNWDAQDRFWRQGVTSYSGIGTCDKELSQSPSENTRLGAFSIQRIWILFHIGKTLCASLSDCKLHVERGA